MNLLKFFVSIVLVPSFAALGSTPSLTFEINPDQKSYLLRVENVTDNDVSCSLVEVSAEIGNEECTTLVATYNYTFKNLTLKPLSKVENGTFGIDFLARKSFGTKDQKLVYCGQPETKFICK